MMMSKVQLLLFLEGLVSVSLQFLYMRHLLPNVGSSVTVASIVVSIFLLFLALGYHYGGEVTAHFRDILSRNFLKAAIVIGIGLSPLPRLFWFESWSEEIPRNALLAAYLLLFMAPPVFWLGQTMPLLANDVQAATKGKVSGTVLFYSTIGNVIGSLVSVLVLMRFAGFGLTALVNIAVLLVLYCYTSTSRTRSASIAVTLALPLTILVYLLEVQLYDKTNQFANYKITTRFWQKEETTDPKRQQRVLMANNLAQSMINDVGETSPYMQFIRERIAAADASQSAPLDVLVLGAGGFTAGYLDTKNRYTYVDIDPSIRDYAEEKFLKKPINGAFVASDARQYLITHPKRWNVIVLDTFSATIAVPAHLATREYFALVKSRLADDGIVIINTVLRKRFGDAYSRRMDRTISSVFPHCMITEIFQPLPPPDSQAVRQSSPNANVVYVCFMQQEDNGMFEDSTIAY